MYPPKIVIVTIPGLMQFPQNGATVDKFSTVNANQLTSIDREHTKLHSSVSVPNRTTSRTKMDRSNNNIRVRFSTKSHSISTAV